MTTVRLEWDLPNAATLIAAGFDYLKVERDTTPPTGWAEVTRPHLRIPIVENMERYCYSDPSGEVNGTFAITTVYRAVPYRSSDGGTDTPISISNAQLSLYCTIQDVRDEGYADPPWTDAKIMRGIQLATAKIERVTRQWYEPRFHFFSFNGPGIDQLFFDVPIITLMAVTQDAQEIDIRDFRVYNRHLTHGQNHPDDRMSPRIGFGRDWEPGYRATRSIISSRFGIGRKTVRVTGLFGYTELSRSDEVGETAVDSQIPLSLGGVPLLIARATTLLAIDMMQPGSASAGNQLNSRLTKNKTRDQEVSYASPDYSSSRFEYGLTGNEEVDYILMDYMGPISSGTV